MCERSSEFGWRFSKKFTFNGYIGFGSARGHLVGLLGAGFLFGSLDRDSTAEYSAPAVIGLSCARVGYRLDLVYSFLGRYGHALLRGSSDCSIL